MKKNRIALATITTLSLGIVASSSIVSLFADNSLSERFYSVSNKNNDILEKNDSQANKNSNQKNVEPTPFDFITSMPLLSQSTGPIVIRKNTIYSLDWFGSQRWKLDLTTAEFNNQSVLPSGLRNGTGLEWRDSVVLNYTLDNNSNTLWVLTNTTNPSSGKQTSQNLVAIDSLNGNVKGSYVLNNGIGNKFSAQYSVTVLQNGNVLIFNDGANRWWRTQIFDVKTMKAMPVQENLKSKTLQEDILKFNSQNRIPEQNVRTNFIFPIGVNKNIMILTNLGDNQADTGNRNSVWFAFVDDDLNRIRTDVNDKYYKPVLISERKSINAATNMANGEGFPKLTYTLADGRILFCIYNKLFVFFPNEMRGHTDLVYKTFDIGLNDGNGDGKYYPVESWTTDTDNNVYVKYANSGTINKFIFTGSSSTDTQIQTSTYFNLSGIDNNTPANQKIFEHAKDFVLYNVYGYTGQIMLLNPYRVTNLKKIPENFDGTVNKNNDYGLAAAIVNNKNSVGGGDLKGLLNTENAFLKSSDFLIPDDILRNKLPSEINRTDIQITENGFFTRNNSTDSQGKLLYPQFTKVMDDEKRQDKNLKITVNIDQIPWFVDNGIMPENIAPITLTKEFTTGQKIQDRVSWKNESLDYDFKNTLPTKVTLEDVQRFDPFSINLTSQRTTIKGENYPKKEYKIIETNDNTGIIKISMDYSYLPIGVDVSDSNILKSTFTNEYTIFKKTDKKDFNFVGIQSLESENITSIPQLKELSESNLLPSSISANDLNGILRFINTDSSSGYPISKMKFDIQPNDDMGTLKITGTLPSDYYGEETKSFTKTYTGLNKKSDYTFTFKDNPSGFVKKNYRPSEVGEQDIYRYFITYSGYNSSDLKLTLTPNNENGELEIKFLLDGSYPESIANGINGFTKTEEGYVFNQKISGFKRNEEYQTEYQLNFIDDNNKLLDEIKKFTPKQIEQIIKKGSGSLTNNEIKLTINGQEITDEELFVKALVISAGSKIPKKENWTNSNFKYEIYYNDPNGEITVKIILSNIEGLSNDLVFVQRFTGFAKGNQVTTKDILSFKTQTKLFIDNQTFKDIKPSELAKRLENENSKKEEITKYLNFFSGDYTKAISEGNFKLEISYDDIHAYMTIKIIFSRVQVTNPDSLLSYTATYNGFATEQ